MTNLSTGTGIALLAGAIVAYPILDRVMPKADASATHAAAVIAAAAQAEPTIVWYGIGARAAGAYGGSAGGYVVNLPYDVVYRAWSDGRIEAKRVCTGYGCDSSLTPTAGWVVISDPAQGYTYRSDINFDSKVDGADLGTLLADWGDAPRHDITPSECPLSMINP